ncbi:MAG: ABC transporter substrate-binding protein [Thermomicrobiales bacterium]
MQNERSHMSRRRFLAGVSGTAAAAILAACGGTTATNTPQSSPVSATSAGAAPTAAGATTTGATRTGSSPVSATSASTSPTAAGATATSAARAVSSPTTAAAATGRAATAVFAIGSDPTSLDPQAVEEGNERAVNDNIYETLINRDADEKIVPWLAESWTQPDATTYRFKLRQGVKFHNGEPWNADAAVFSAKRVISPELKSQFAANLGTIADAKKVDDMTFDLTTKGPDPSLLARLFSIRMMAPQWTQSAGVQVSSTTNGTGPYKVTNWQRGVSVDLVANDGYWGGAPKVKAAQVRVIPEDQTRLSALQRGEVDLVRGLLPEQLAQAPATAAALGPQYSFIRLSNLSGSIVADKRIRQALNYAVDKETLLKQLHGGQGQVLPGQLAGKEMFGFNPNLQAYPYDPEKAKSLLAAAGASNLSIEIVGTQGRWQADGLEAQAVGGMLNKVGVQTKITLQNFQQWLKTADRAQTPNTPPVLYIQHDNTLFDADRTVSGYYTDAGSFSTYKNPAIDPLITQARSETDVKKREQLYWQIFELGRDDPPMIFMLQVADTWGVSKRLQWKPVPDGRALFKDMALG